MRLCRLLVLVRSLASAALVPHIISGHELPVMCVGQFIALPGHLLSVPLYVFYLGV